MLQQFLNVVLTFIKLKLAETESVHVNDVSDEVEEELLRALLVCTYLPGNVNDLKCLPLLPV